MKTKVLFLIACLGIFAGVVSVLVYNEKVKSQPPLTVSYNPYEKGIYATGIVESYQPSGSNVNIFPEVSGKVTGVFVRDGQVLKKGTPILSLDDTVQKELVEKDAAQIQYELANLVNLKDQLAKIKKSYSLDAGSVSKNALDNAINAVKIAEESLNVAKAQYRTDKALLDKYVIGSPIDGMILRVGTAIGDYLSPQGHYDAYTQAMLPAVEMGVVTPYLEVRCFLDEILVPSLPNPTRFEATMFVRGESNKRIPLEFVRIQPYLTPKVQLSNQRTERVDVRVLPIIFRFKKPADMNVYPGQLTDIYIKGKK